MRKIVRKENWSIILIAVLMLCTMLLGIFTLLPEKENKAAAAGETSNLALSVDKVKVVPGVDSEFLLTVTMSTTRAGCIWFAMDMTIGVLNADGTAFDVEAAKGLAVKVNSRNKLQINYGDLPEYDYMTTASNDKLATAGFFRLVISSNGDYKDGSEEVTVQVPITVAGDTAAHSVTFGVLQAGGSFTNSDAYALGQMGPTDKPAAKGTYDGLIAVQTATVNIGNGNTVGELESVSVGHGTANSPLTLSENMSFTSTSENATNFKVKPTLSAASTGATIKVGTTNPATGNSVASGTEATVALNTSTGITDIYITVIPEAGGDGKTWAIKVTSGYVRISSVAVTSNSTSGATKNGLASAFNKETESYTINVPSDATSVSITPRVAGGYGIKSAIAVGKTGCTAANTVNSESALTVTDFHNNDKVTLTATAADGTAQKTYTFTFQIFSADTTIASFTAVDDGGNTLNSDSTQAGDFYFTLPPTSANPQCNFVIAATDSGATVQVDGKAYDRNAKFAVGAHSVKVTAPAGNSKTYSVNVVRGAVDSVKFSSLEYYFEGETPEDVFASANYNPASNTFTKTYTLSSTYNVGKSIYIRGELPIGVTVGSQVGLTKEDDAYKGTLKFGKNEFRINLTDGGSRVVSYIFIVNLLEDKNGIENIAITSDGTALSGFTFNKATGHYDLEIPYTMVSLSFLITTDGNYTRVYTERGGLCDKGTQAMTHTFTRRFEEGDNQVSIRAVKNGEETDETGAKYTFTIKRKEVERINTLTDLVVKVGGTIVDLTPEFNENIEKYSIQLPSDTQSAIVDLQATAKGLYADVAGTGTHDISFGSGVATVVLPITVTAQDGTKKIYQVAITREEIKLDGNFDVKNIEIIGSDTETYFQSFSAATYNYEITVPYAVQTASISVTTISASATVSGAGVKTLNEGENVFEVYAIAEDGSNSNGAVKYVFKITREMRITEIYLSDISINNATVEGFQKEVYTYESRFDRFTDKVVLNATADDSRATITVSKGGETLAEAVGYVSVDNLALGAEGTTTTITITVALDGTIRPYTVRIVRASERPFLTFLDVGNFPIFDNQDCAGTPIDGTKEEIVSVLQNFYVQATTDSGVISIEAHSSDPASSMRLALNRTSLEKTGDNIWSLDLEELFSAEGEKRIQVSIYPANGRVVTYEIYFTALSSNTDANITINEIEDFNANYNLTGLVFGAYNVGYKVDKLTLDVAFILAQEYMEEGTYQFIRQYNDTDKLVLNEYGTALKEISLDFGENILLVNLRSSDMRATRTVVIIVNRARADFDSLTIAEIEQFESDYMTSDKDAKTYSAVYTVANDVKSLTISVKVADGLLAKVEGGEELQVGLNEIVIKLYAVSGTANSSLAENSEGGGIDGENEDNFLKIVRLNVYREEAEENAALIWMILFFILLVFAIIELLVIIFIPKRKKKRTTLRNSHNIVISQLPQIAQQPMYQQPILQQPMQPMYPQQPMYQQPIQPVYPQQPIVQQPPQQPQQPSGKNPVNIEVHIASDGQVTTFDGNGNPINTNQDKKK